VRCGKFIFSKEKKSTMSKKFFPTDVVSQCQSISNAWAQIDMKLAFGDLNIGSLAVDLEEAAKLMADIDRLETTLVNKTNQRDELYARLWDQAKRIRAGIKATYGDDSSQYEMVGGTRISERKTPRRSATPAA
jgi:hypothetical protein